MATDAVVRARINAETKEEAAASLLRTIPARRAGLNLIYRADRRFERTGTHSE